MLADKTLYAVAANKRRNKTKQKTKQRNRTDLLVCVPARTQ